MASHLFIQMSVTLMYRGHIGWNTSKKISWLISLGFLLSADSNITDLLQREHPKILAGIGVGMEKKVSFSVQKL